MDDLDRKETLKLIQAGLREFPKVLARKDMAFKEREKRLKAFESLSKTLYKMQTANTKK